MASRSYKQWLRALQVALWMSYLAVAVDSYLRHHDNLSIAMICIGAVGFCIQLIAFRLS